MTDMQMWACPGVTRPTLLVRYNTNHACQVGDATDVLRGDPAKQALPAHREDLLPLHGPSDQRHRNRSHPCGTCIRAGVWRHTSPWAYGAEIMPKCIHTKNESIAIQSCPSQNAREYFINGDLHLGLGRCRRKGASRHGGCARSACSPQTHMLPASQRHPPPVSPEISNLSLERSGISWVSRTLYTSLG